MERLHYLLGLQSLKFSHSSPLRKCLLTPVVALYLFFIPKVLMPHLDLSTPHACMSLIPLPSL